MKVFYASLDSANNAVMPWSNIWNMNLYMTLTKIFNVVMPSFSVSTQYAICFERIKSEMTPEQARNYFSYKLLEDITREEKRSHINLFFSYYYSKCILPEVIDEIKRLGIVTVNFYCNSIHQFHLVSEIAPHFDYCIFPERNALQKYIDVGAHPIYIQMAANPDFYKPYALKAEYDVSFVGQRYLNREEYIEYLLGRGINIFVWGAGWSNSSGLSVSHVGGPLSDEELIKMFSRSRISLNFSEVLVQDQSKDAGHIKRHIRLRDFEAPMSGAFYMTGYQDELAEYYEIGKEIVCYDTKEELLDKTRYYLKHPEEAEIIRRAGRARALRDHKWENRFVELFKKIGFCIE